MKRIGLKTLNGLTIDDVVLQTSDKREFDEKIGKYASGNIRRYNEKILNYFSGALDDSRIQNANLKQFGF